MRLQEVLLLIIVSLLEPARGAVDRDWSFEAMCDAHKGVYKNRSIELGAECTVTFPRAFTEDQEEADELCLREIPYHILKATPGDKTVCRAEATLVCRSGWIQMYGRCYKMTKEMMTHADATKHCTEMKDADNKTIGARVAFLHRDLLVPRWKGYFKHVSRMWLDASPIHTNNLLYNKGPNSLIVFYGHHFGVRPMSLIRVPEHEKAMVLCEYTPPMTQAESNYLMRRYNEIYYKAIQTRDGVYFRTSSSRIRNHEDGLSDSEYCNRVVSPVLKTIGARTAVPTKRFKEELVEERSATIIRTSGYYLKSSEAIRNVSTCALSIDDVYGVDVLTASNTTLHEPVDAWRSGKPAEKCDGASWSTGFSLSRSSNDTGLEDMSDARSAPIYCQPLFEIQEYQDCPRGYTQYFRQNGQKWCHKFIQKPPVNYTEAEKVCRRHRAYLSGYTDTKELELIDSLATNINGTFEITGNVWLGAKRRSECNKLASKDGKTPGFELNADSPCSKENVFEWKNGVAPNPPKIFNDWLWSSMPDFFQANEICLEMMKKYKDNWNRADPKDDYLKINDRECEARNHVLCGREAPILVRRPT